MIWLDEAKTLVEAHLMKANRECSRQIEGIRYRARDLVIIGQLSTIRYDFRWQRYLLLDKVLPGSDGLRIRIRVRVFGRRSPHIPEFSEAPWHQSPKSETKIERMAGHPNSDTSLVNFADLFYIKDPFAESNEEWIFLLISSRKTDKSAKFLVWIEFQATQDKENQSI